MNDRKYHLTYCTICVNRKHNIDCGYICSLTNEKADFDKECEHYNEDPIENNEIIKKINDRLDSNYSKGFWGREDPRGDYEKLNLEELNAHQQNPKEIIKRGNSKFNGILILMFGTLPLPYFIPNFINSLNNDESQQGISFLIFILLPLILITIGITTILNKKTYFVADEFSISFETRKIYYNDILTIGRSCTYSGSGSSSKNAVVLGTKTQGIFEYDLAEINIDVNEIGKIIKKRRITAVCCNYACKVLYLLIFLVFKHPLVQHKYNKSELFYMLVNTSFFELCFAIHFLKFC